jgi:hypothetical protein
LRHIAKPGSERQPAPCRIISSCEDIQEQEDGMARYDDDRRDMKYAYGRYSGSDQGDDRRSEERRDHGLYGYGPEEAPGYGHEPGGWAERWDDRGDYYDPDHLYRSPDRYNSGYGGRGYGRREYGRHPREDRPYGQRPYPGGEYDQRRRGGFDMHERELGAWRRPSSWYGGESGQRESEPEDEGYSWRVSHGYRGAGGYRSLSHEIGGEPGHRGRGPKGYVRSDERIKEDVCDYLTDDPYLDAADMEVAVTNGEVTLAGRVGSRHAKRRAEELAERASGVKHVQNNLRVGDRSQSSSDDSASSFARTAGRRR